MDQYCYRSNPVRLACLIHAASVRSEPESNSQKKNLSFEPLAGLVVALAQTIAVFSNHRFSRTDVPFAGNGCIVYQKFRTVRKGVFEKNSKKFFAETPLTDARQFWYTMRHFVRAISSVG